MPGRAHSATQNAMVAVLRTPGPAGLAGAEGGGDLYQAAMIAHTPTISTRTSAVGPGQASS